MDGAVDASIQWAPGDCQYTVEDVKDDLHRVEEVGFYGTDEQPNIVNFFGLELSPTPHGMQIGGRKLFAG